MTVKVFLNIARSGEKVLEEGAVGIISVLYKLIRIALQSIKNTKLIGFCSLDNAVKDRASFNACSEKISEEERLHN